MPDTDLFFMSIVNNTPSFAYAYSLILFVQFKENSLIGYLYNSIKPCTRSKIKRTTGETVSPLYQKSSITSYSSLLHCHCQLSFTVHSTSLLFISHSVLFSFYHHHSLPPFCHYHSLPLSINTSDIGSHH
jgi:hypothetical protein